MSEFDENENLSEEPIDNVGDLDNADLGDAELDSDESQTEAEAEARALGWTEEEKFRGDPKRWLPPEEYIKLHSNNNSALKRRLERVERESAERISKMESHFKTLHDEAMARKESEHQDAIQFLKLQRKSLREEGRFDEADDITDRLHELSSSPPKPEQAQATPDQNAWRSHPGVPEWLDDNPWVDNDTELAAFANTYGMHLAQVKDPSVGKGVEFLKKVELATKRAFPEKFGRRTQSVESTTTGSAVRKGKMTYDTLPKAAKAACDELVEDGVLTREQYVKHYTEFS